MKSTRWYMRYLQRYFDKYFGEYGDTAGWLVNPAPNKWQFIILELNLKVTLTCDDYGRVREKREIIN